MLGPDTCESPANASEPDSMEPEDRSGPNAYVAVCRFFWIPAGYLKKRAVTVSKAGKASQAKWPPLR